MTSPLVPQRFSRLATTTVVPSPSLALTPTPSTSAAPPRTIGAALEPLLNAPSSIATRASEKRHGPATGCPGSDDPEASDKRKREASSFNAGQVHSLKFPHCVTLFFILKYIHSLYSAIRRGFRQQPLTAKYIAIIFFLVVAFCFCDCVSFQLPHYIKCDLRGQTYTQLMRRGRRQTFLPSKQLTQWTAHVPEN